MASKGAKKKAAKTAKKVTSKVAGKTGRNSARKVSGKTGHNRVAGKKTGSRRKPAGKKTSQTAPALRIELGCEPGIRTVAELHRQLLGVVDSNQGVTIDAASVERVDTAVLQVLTAFVVERKRQKKAINWEGPAPAFYQAASLIDLAGHLDLPPPKVEQ